MIERWLPIKGYEDRYEVSERGVVRNIQTGHVLAQHRWGGREGYPTVTLCRSGAGKKRSIHSLLMEHFVGPCPPGQEVNHKDGDKGNHALSNLEYVTRKENRAHAVRTGLLVIHGANNKRAKLTEEQARTIKYSGGKIGDVAARYRVTHRVVSLIRRGLLWRHIQ